MTKVKLREKPIKGNIISLYLDFYPPLHNPSTGVRTRREFLNTFLYSEIEYEKKTYLGKDKKRESDKMQVGFKPVEKNGRPKVRKLTQSEKRHNEIELAKADEKKAQRQISINAGDLSFLAGKSKPTDFIKYFEEISKERTGSSLDGWTSALKHLKRFAGESLSIANLNRSFCNDFRKHLLTAAGVAHNSAATYFSKFKAALTQAYTSEPQLLTIDLNAVTDAIPEEKTHRNFVTSKELQALINTDCEKPEIKAAAIFSALTNLRWSDIEKLKWSEIKHRDADGYYLQYIQQKTKKVEVLPIPNIAVGVKLIGEQKGPDDKVFPTLFYSSDNNRIMREWVKDAGITKHITFHSFRHTWAMLQEERGTGIHTFSKMLGHSDLQTTQIYAHPGDPAKRSAADKMNDFDLSKMNKH